MCQFKIAFGYNDTAHFKLRRCDYFKKIKIVWTAMRRRSKMRVKKKMFSILKEEAYLYDRPTKIILRAKRKHPNYLPEEIENIIIHYRKKTGFGKRRLNYHIYDKEKIYIPESTIGKLLKRRNLVRWNSSSQAFREIQSSYIPVDGNRCSNPH